MMMHRHCVSCCVVLASLVTAVQAADLANNIENSVAGAEVCTPSEPIAVMFTTQGIPHDLSLVDLRLAGSSDAVAVLTLHEDGGMAPGEPIASLTPMAPPGELLDPVAFVPTMPIALQPHSVYWLTLNTTGGTVHWAWSEDDFGEGPGFNRDWARVAHDSGLWW
ncbi:MAG: hypothetical protein MK074_09865, partial [Phycisphaerales bacterium]|nr:hypothetical protein [Phycisphaerales bacterium]